MAPSIANSQQPRPLQVLDRLSAVPAEVVEDARKKYRHIHVAMLQTLSDAAALEDRVAQLATYLQVGG